MNQNTLYAELTKIMRDVFDDDTIVAASELTAADVAEWDSLSHLRLIVTVQRAFNVKFSAGEVGRLKNVGDLAQLIQTKTA